MTSLRRFKKDKIKLCDKGETLEAAKSPFSKGFKIFEALFYLPHLCPINVPEEYEERAPEAFNLTNKGVQLKTRADLRPDGLSADLYCIK
ncbi:hypothetical protein MTR_1g004950 [Medicago truncatula]|uniref:Uncharacterized protein n=1 Tax=Medicago truncatula TaxID=3880 RepID=A0A072VE14_MEDTR|nr:hypothetical protein MTR_1g004950 [Medicago truncatula]